MMKLSSYSNSSDVPPSGIENPTLGQLTASSIKELAGGISRLAVAIERSNKQAELALSPEISDAGTCRTGPQLASERDMAGLLNIKPRTLANYRRTGRLPGCWVRNGRRILWRVDATVAAWKKGIA